MPSNARLREPMADSQHSGVAVWLTHSWSRTVTDSLELATAAHEAETAAPVVSPVRGRDVRFRPHA